MTHRKAAVLGGNRIPFARSNKEYAHASNQDMLTSALDGLVARHGLAGQRLGEVAGGAVLKHSKDINLTREAVLGSALSPETPAFDLGQACATGLEAVVAAHAHFAAAGLKAGQVAQAPGSFAVAFLDALYSVTDSELAAVEITAAAVEVPA